MDYWFEPGKIAGRVDCYEAGQGLESMPLSIKGKLWF